MLPIKKIVCPTDFSDPAYEGLNAAVEFATHFSAELILLHIISPVPMIPGSAAPTGFHVTAVLEEMQASAENSIEDLAKGKVPEAIQTRTIVFLGRPAYEIVNIAASEDADILILSTHGESGWQRFISGSVAEKVVRLASCPVLTVQAPNQKA